MAAGPVPHGGAGPDSFVDEVAAWSQVFLLAAPPVFRAPSARPPARRPRRELRSARRLEARPGPAAPPALSALVARGEPRPRRYETDCGGVSL